MSRPDIDAITRRLQGWTLYRIESEDVADIKRDLSALLDYVSVLEDLLRLQLKGSGVTLEALLWGREEADKIVNDPNHRKPLETMSTNPESE